jgi:hypothetical protein
MESLRSRIGWLVCRPELTEKLRAKGVVEKVTDRCEDEDGIWETVHFVKGVEEESWGLGSEPFTVCLFKDGGEPIISCLEKNGICW